MKKTLLPLFIGLLTIGQILFAQDLYDINTIKELRIIFPKENWDASLDYKKRKGKKRSTATLVTIDGTKLDSVGVRYKGNSSYNKDRTKNPLNLKLSYVKKKQRYNGFTTLKLSNVFRDPSFVREVLAFEIARDYMIAPQANFMNVYINDQHFGLYSNVESIGDVFRKTYFGCENNPFFKCDPTWGVVIPKHCAVGDKASLQYLGKDPACYQDKYEMKSKVGWEDLTKLTKALEGGEMDEIEKVLDVHQALWMLAFNNVLVNLDSYTGLFCHNYYLYKDSTQRFVPLLWDLNMAFGGFRFADKGKSLSVGELQSLSPLLHADSPHRPLISQLLKHETYQKQYLAHIRTILQEHFVNDRYLDRAKELQSLIAEDVRKDKNKFYTDTEFKTNLYKNVGEGSGLVAGIVTLMEGRTEYLLRHPLVQKTPPTINNVKHEVTDTNIQLTAHSIPASQVYLYYRFNPYHSFKKITMRDNGKKGDKVEGDGIFSVQLSVAEGTLQYYLYAENEDAGVFLPKRAGKEVYTVEKSVENRR